MFVVIKFCAFPPAKVTQWIYKDVLANISRSRCNTRAVWMKWNGLVADNVAHAAGASILSLVHACVRE